MNRQSSKKGYGHAYVAAMVLDSFHPFLSLPFELRRMIYLHASPPRFVHVREHTEDKDAFEERFRTTVAQIKLHPSIAYFARQSVPRSYLSSPVEQLLALISPGGSRTMSWVHVLSGIY